MMVIEIFNENNRTHLILWMVAKISIETLQKYRMKSK